MTDYYIYSHNYELALQTKDIMEAKYFVGAKAGTFISGVDRKVLLNGYYVKTQKVNMIISKEFNQTIAA